MEKWRDLGKNLGKPPCKVVPVDGSMYLSPIFKSDPNPMTRIQVRSPVTT